MYWDSWHVSAHIIHTCHYTTSVMLVSGSATLNMISACYCHTTEHALGRQMFLDLGMIPALAKLVSLIFLYKKC